MLYALLPEEALALVVTPQTERIVALGSTPDLESAVEEARLHRPDGDGAAALARLERLLVAPLALEAATRVLVSPDGALGRVPLPALFGARDVVAVPSGTTYAALRGESGRRGRGVLALGDPDLGAASDPEAAALYLAPGAATRGAPQRLPRAREEARAVGEVVLVDREATETALRETLGTRERWRAVHLACHAWFDPSRPLRSSLMLAPSTTDDGFLTALEVLRLHVPADLVALSACESGRGKAYRAEGLMGLPRAFLLAGAPRVLCSLWKVDDAATGALMTRFYELWDPKGAAAGAAAATALRRAQEHVRSTKGWEHPYYWAAWVLWGLPN